MKLFEQKAPGIMALLMQDFSLTVYDAAAILGNIGEESGGFELFQEQSPIGGGTGGYGWAQWTGPRRTQFMAYCSRNSLDAKSDKANYGFLFTELKGAYAKAIDKVRAATGLPAKVAAFMNNFEMPNAKYAHLEARVAYANRAMAVYSETPGAAPVQIDPTPVAAAGTTKETPMFNITNVIGLIGQAPTIIEGVMQLVDEVQAGYAQGKAAGGDPIVIFEDILAQLVQHKGSVAKAVLGPEPVVTPAGAIVPKK